MTITAAMVKELRALTGAGIMDAKKALTANDGDIQASVDWLRAKGMAKAAAKSSRAAGDGVIAIKIAGGTAVAVEVNSETDFVAKNAEFREFVSQVVDLAVGVDDIENLLSAKIGNDSVQETLNSKIASLGENLIIRRMTKISGDCVAGYVHNAVGEGMGKIGALVALSGEDSGIGRQIAMHVAASKPIALSESDVPNVVVDRERQILETKARETGKPDFVVEKIVEGGLKKFFSDETLLNQNFVIDPKTTVGKAAANAKTAITGFIRMEVGEGDKDPT